MEKKPPPPPAAAPHLPDVDPAAMEDAARRFLRKSKPPGGWKPGKEIRQTSEGNGT